jgi:hypothetical protein
VAVLIDPPAWHAHARRWSHLVSDTSLAELHRFASGLGVPDRGFEGDHYDVPEEYYAAAVSAGAIPVSARELLRRLQASGLRRPKRRGERVLASHPDGGPDGIRVDVVLSRLPPLGTVLAVHLLAVWRHHVLVLPDGEGYVLPSAPAGPASGAEPVAAAVVVVASLLGRTVSGSALTPVGYLRRVGPVPGRPHAVEPLLRWAADGRHEPTRGAWVAAHHAEALVPRVFAPLVRPGVGGGPGTMAR